MAESGAHVGRGRGRATHAFGAAPCAAGVPAGASRPSWCALDAGPPHRDRVYASRGVRETTRCRRGARGAKTRARERQADRRGNAEDARRDEGPTSQAWPDGVLHRWARAARLRGEVPAGPEEAPGEGAAALTRG